MRTILRYGLAVIAIIMLVIIFVIASRIENQTDYKLTTFNSNNTNKPVFSIRAVPNLSGVTVYCDSLLNDEPVHDATGITSIWRLECLRLSKEKNLDTLSLDTESLAKIKTCMYLNNESHGYCTEDLKNEQ